MSIALLDELMAPFLAPRIANAQPNLAKAANVELRRAVWADSAPCEGLRIPAKAEPDSQTFAGLRNSQTGAQSEHRCGSSQDSQDSQWWRAICATVGADELDAVAWTDADIAHFSDRRNRLLHWGWTEADAEKQAERLVKRDREQDDRVSCTDCRHYRPGRCGNCKAAGLGSADVGRDFAAMLQRCPGFEHPSR